MKNLKTFLSCSMPLAVVFALCSGGNISADFTSPFANDDGFVKRKQRAVLFVLDISGSMRGNNIQAVRGTLKKVAATYPDEAGIGLVTFSGCKASDVLLQVPVAPGNAGQVVAKAEDLRPYGSTDIFGGLKIAQGEVARLGPDWCVKVLLLSDGTDTCGNGDHKSIAKKIAGGDESCNKVSAISIGVHNWDSDIFDEIAEAGKGEHNSANDMEEAEEMIREELENEFEREIGGDWSGDYTGTGPGDNTRPGGGRDSNDKGDPNKNPDDPLENEKEHEKEQNGT